MVHERENTESKKVLNLRGKKSKNGEAIFTPPPSWSPLARSNKTPTGSNPISNLAAIINLNFQRQNACYSPPFIHGGARHPFPNNLQII